MMGKGHGAYPGLVLQPLLQRGLYSLLQQH
jgi:hypothetical protein